MKKKEHLLYRRWQAIMSRCYNKRDSRYRYYGAKGITVSERWHDFWSFVEDVDNHLENGHLLYEGPNWQLDKDKNGGKIYSLENCVVITAEENKKLIINHSQQKSIVAINSENQLFFHSINEANRKLNIPSSTITYHVKHGTQHKNSYYFFYFCKLIVA